MDGVPISVALVAGALSTLNPCGFPLLPAFLTSYVGTDQPELPPMPARVAQGLLTGALVTAGFLAVFSVVGIPLSYGARAVAGAVPFAGIAIGVLLAGFGIRGVFGSPLTVRLPLTVSPGSGRGARSMLLFGAGYALASLACTLPVFLALVGASLSAGGSISALVVFAAYGAGMAVVLMALALAAAVVRHGLARRVRRILPALPRLSAALLIVSGTYVTYYWLRFRYGSAATVASDPVVGMVSRFTARVEVLAADGGLWLVTVPGSIVAVAVCGALWKRWRRSAAPNRPGGIP